MMEFKQSPVAFSENPHGYWLGDKRLMGITGLIHSVLKLGVYPDASEFVKKVAIPRAGEYGSAVHKAIEQYDTLGVEMTLYPNSFYPNNAPNEIWDVSQELQSYIKHRKGFAPVANEYTVSDGEKWASNIDNVWKRETTGGIWLIDTKTNNLDYYPLDGYGTANRFADHEAGLKEYLSWQLSIYAELFEAQNPGTKVEGLACNWLRKGDAAFWIIERKPTDKVKELLSSTWEEVGDSIIYRHHDPCGVFGVAEALPIPIAPQSLIVPADVIALVYDVQRQLEEAKTKSEELKTLLRSAMEREGVKSWDSGLFKATIAVDTTVNSFDTTAFKKAYPDLYKQFTVAKPKKGGFTIKLRDK